MGYIGETAFHELGNIENRETTAGNPDHLTLVPTDFDFLPDVQFYTDMSNGAPTFVRTPGYSGGATWDLYNFNAPNNIIYPISFAYHIDGRRIPSGQPISTGGAGTN